MYYYKELLVNTPNPPISVTFIGSSKQFDKTNLPMNAPIKGHCEDKLCDHISIVFW